jgi:putative protease
MGEWSNRYGSQATERKVYAGKAVKYWQQAGVAEFLIQAAEIRRGEKLLVTGPTTGAVYVEAVDPWVDGKQCETVCKGQHLTFKINEKVRENDKLYVMRKEVPGQDD